jgi:GTP cyclohydrolase IA
MENLTTNPQDPRGPVKSKVVQEAEDVIAALIVLIGDDPDREGLRDTPRRVLKSFNELYAGYGMDPKKILGTTFEKSGYDQMVILRDIEFYSACEHHLVTFVGKAHVGYVPNERVVGLSKLARLVECFSRRLQIQERMTQEIADAMDEHLKPKGVMVVVEAKHFCMCSRGVQKQHSSMVTSAIKGVFEKGDARTEFMALLKN